MLKLVTCSDPNEAARNDVNLWNSGQRMLGLDRLGGDAGAETLVPVPVVWCVQDTVEPVS